MRRDPAFHLAALTDNGDLGIPDVIAAQPPVDDFRHDDRRTRTDALLDQSQVRCLDCRKNRLLQIRVRFHRDGDSQGFQDDECGVTTAWRATDAIGDGEYDTVVGDGQHGNRIFAVAMVRTAAQAHGYPTKWQVDIGVFDVVRENSAV